MSDRDWLANVKQGDAVIIEGGGAGRKRSVGRIARLTATRFMVTTDGSPETGYRRKDGQEVGGSLYWSATLREGTPEAIKAVRDENRRIKLAEQLNHRNWRNVSLERLEAITAILSVPDSTKEGEPK